MAKENGLGQSMFISGVDISDDVREWNASGGPALLDFTSINKSAMVRKGGLHTAGIGATLFFNDAVDESFQTLKAMPSTDRIISLLTGNTLGDAAWCLTGKQSDLAYTRAPDGMFTLNLPALSNLRRGHWTQSLLAGKVTHASATNGTGIDYGAVSTLFGLTAYLQVFSLGSGTPTVKLQDSADNVTFADITGGGFTAIAGVTSEVIETAATETIRRYVRVISTGTFTDLVFWVGFCRHLTLSIDS